MEQSDGIKMMDEIIGDWNSNETIWHKDHTNGRSHNQEMTMKTHVNRMPLLIYLIKQRESSGDK